MTVFKTFLKILNKNKITLIIYTAILVVFGVSNMKTNEKNMNFIADKPDVAVINYDEDGKLAKSLVKYVKENSNVIDVEDERRED